jgi:hypothetical protein
MKNIFVLVLASVAIARACNAADYCPLAVGDKWVLAGEVNGRTIEFVQEVKGPGTRDKRGVCTLESWANGRLLNTIKFCFRDNSLLLLEEINARGDTVFSPPRQEMVRNAKVGDRWSWHAENSSDYLNYEVLREEAVTVPAGHFRAIVVKTSGVLFGMDVGEALAWYADMVGTIKEEASIGQLKMIRVLTSYKVN